VGRIRRLEQALTQRNQELEFANAALTEANASLEEELVAAAAVQQALLPPTSFAVPGAHFAWDFRPCERLAGDLLGLVPIKEGQVALHVLDVVGHGVKAALLAVMVSRVLSEIVQPAREAAGARRPLSPSQVLDSLNRAFPGPYLLAANGRGEFLRAQGTPIGVRGRGYEEHAVTLNRRDRVFLFSDGLFEAPDPGGRFFGQERVATTLERGLALPLGESLTAMMGAVEQWLGPNPSQDDLSILAMEFEGLPNDERA
jgi:sigma-B regulation protein RsbU (phosphoserine phosphatase)